MIKRLKPLLPTLKEKKRYLAFEIVSKSRIKTFSEISRAIWHSTLGFVGTQGVARLGIWVFPETYDATSQKGLIRVEHNGLDDLKASLALITKIEDQDVIVRSIGASGILMKAKKRYIGG